MPFLMIGKVLDGATGVKKDGHAYLFSEEIDASIFVHLGQEVLQIPRIQRLEPAPGGAGGDALLISTHKGERFYFPPEQIVGLKFGPTEAKRPGGFQR